MDHHYNSKRANRAHLDFHENLPEARREPAAVCDEPLVSICVCHFTGHAALLKQTLSAVAKSDYKNYEVIVADGGGTLSGKIRKRYAHRENWVFPDIKSGDPAAVRNAAAQRAAGEYLIFVDSGDSPYPHMVSTLVQSAVFSGLDCLTCQYRGFRGDTPPRRESEALHRHAPLGACLDLGPFENVFGHITAIIKSDVFRSLGGFGNMADSSGVWEFFLRLNVAGHTMDTIPEPLFQHRLAENTPDTWKLQKRVLDSFMACLPGHAQSLLNNYALPLRAQFAKLRETPVIEG